MVFIPPVPHFDVIQPQRIVFGWGKRTELGRLGAGLGRRAFVVDGSRSLRSTSLWDEILGSLREAGVQVEHVASATREPTIEDVDAAARTIHSLVVREGDFVIGIGGGSGLDLAKAVAAMATSGAGYSVRDFLEGVGTGRKLELAPLPILAMPTTAGTGAEATRNAVISVTDPPCKKSLRHDGLMPRVALVDPELTLSCPSQQTAWSGMDALTQIIESCVSSKSQSRASSASCVVQFPEAMRIAVHQEDNPGVRSYLSWAALQSGIALTNCGLGMAHGVAAALGAISNVPHGLACATLLPISIRVNRVHPEALKKYASLNHWLELANTKSVTDYWDEKTWPALCDAFQATILNLSRDLGIPSRLRDLGVKFEEIPAIVAGSRGNSMSCNPRELTDRELTAILEENW